MASLQSGVLQRGRRTEGCTGEGKAMEVSQDKRNCNGDKEEEGKRRTGETRKRRANTEIAKHFDQTFFKFDDTACLSGV